MDPFILTKFIKPRENEQGDPVVSLVVFEWSDKNLIGAPSSNGDGTESVSSYFGPLAESAKYLTCKYCSAPTSATKRA